MSKEVVQSLNKFERARLLSARALELSKGDKPKVKLVKKANISKDYVLIAEQELAEGKLDLEIYK
jgi:DNA-directed RNA polymerase subunit K/omega